MAKNVGLLNSALKVIARVLSPHLSKGLGSRRVQTNPNWREDPRPIPPPLPFNPAKITHADKLGKVHSPADVRRPYRILCLDGGGVRGTLTIAILQRIIKQHPTFLENVDAIVGTSAGGILSLLLSAGYNPDQCDKIFDFAMPHIFGHNPWRILNPWRAKYSDKSKQELMKFYFGDRKMVDLEKTCTVVAFRLDGRKSDTHSFFHKEGWRPAIFSNMHQGASKVLPDTDLFVWDAAMATSAAPTFFPVHNGYCDGGIVANNPSIVAFSKALSHLPSINSRNCVLLSLGAGSYPRHTNIFSASTREGEVVVGRRGNKKLKRADWGIKQWIPFLLDLLLDGDSITSEMVMQYMLGNNGLYHRLDPSLPRQFALDDVSCMQDLRDFAQTVDISETCSFIEKNFLDDYIDGDSAGYNSLDSSTNYHEAWSKAQAPGRAVA